MKNLVNNRIWRVATYLAIAYLVSQTIVAILRMGQFTSAMIHEFRKQNHK